MKKFLIGGLVLWMSFALAGCNTIGGIGQDLKAAGGAITNTAEKTKEKVSK